MAGHSRRSGRTNASFQEERSLASTAIRPAVFIPRAKHRHPQTRPVSAASSAVRVGADGAADLRASQVSPLAGQHSDWADRLEIFSGGPEDFLLAIAFVWHT